MNGYLRSIKQIDVTKRTILVLGAGSDIAKAVARQYAANGFSVQLAGRSLDKLNRLRCDLHVRYGTEVSCHFLDISDLESHDLFVNSFSGTPDVVLYAAGAMSEQCEAINNWSLAYDMITVNYMGAVSLLNRFALKMGVKGSGTIIGISSVAGERGRGSNYLYGSTKAAFSTYCSGLRHDFYKKGVHVITVKPGFVYTKMTQHLSLPPLLTATPELVARSVYIGAERKRNVIYIKPIWKIIMLIIKALPEPLFKRTSL